MSQVRSEANAQFASTFRMYQGIVRRFDDDTWRGVGLGHVVPARVAIHIPTSIEFYIEHESELFTRFETEWTRAAVDSFPSREEAGAHATVVHEALACWIDAMDPDEPNTKFPWAGATQTGVLLFMMRHTLYHVGELNALLYESRRGEVGDPWTAEFQRG